MCASGECNDNLLTAVKLYRRGSWKSLSLKVPNVIRKLTRSYFKVFRDYERGIKSDEIKPLLLVSFYTFYFMFYCFLIFYIFLIVSHFLYYIFYIIIIFILLYRPNGKSLLSLRLCRLYFSRIYNIITIQSVTWIYDGVCCVVVRSATGEWYNFL